LSRFALPGHFSHGICAGFKSSPSAEIEMTARHI
jgi:hypothetical protein